MKLERWLQNSVEELQWFSIFVKKRLDFYTWQPLYILQKGNSFLYQI